jgi:ATP-dependent helicase HrpB
VVVDSGLVRQSSYDVARGFDSLGVVKIARAAADQRAGRAGRTGPGRCVRLWSESDHRNRKEFETPEVCRVDLAEAILFLKRLGVNEITDFRWLDQPENERRLDAEKLLTWLGALDSGGRLMEAGKQMAALPLHPRLSALVLQGGDCLGEVLFVAAAVQGEGVFKRAGRGQKWAELLEGEPGWGNDFGAEWLAMMAAKNLDFQPRECDGLGVLARGARETWKNFQQLGRLLKKRGERIKEPDFRQRGEACARAMLVAFGDRLAVRRDQGSAVCHLVGGAKREVAS